MVCITKRNRSASEFLDIQFVGTFEIVKTSVKRHNQTKKRKKRKIPGVPGNPGIFPGIIPLGTFFLVFPGTSHPYSQDMLGLHLNTNKTFAFY